MPRTDILQRKEEILKWINENQPKAFICRQLNCKPETLNSYLKSLSPQGVEKCPENTQILFRKLLEGGCYGNKTC